MDMDHGITTHSALQNQQPRTHRQKGLSTKSEPKDKQDNSNDI